MSKSHSASYKNPLLQAFGMSLRKHRGILGLSYDEVADAIGIGSSFYRLVESGTNHLHVRNVVSLIDAFSGRLKFDGVSKILMAISIMEMTANKAEKVENRPKADGLKEAVEKLSAYDEHKLKPLFDKFKIHGIFELIENSDADTVAKAIKEAHLDEDVSGFLTDYEDFGKATGELQRHYLLDSLDRVPAIYFDFITQTIENILQLPAAMPFEGSNQWELKNEMHLESMICFCKDYKSILNPENFEKYQYPYLWVKDFDNVKFVFSPDISDIATPNSLKKEFGNLLRKSLEKSRDQNTRINNFLMDFDKGVNKVHIQIVNDASKYYEEFKSLHVGSNVKNSEEEYNFDAVWVFTLTDNRHVGFLAVMDYGSAESKEKSKLVYGVSLTFKEAIKRRELMDLFWRKIEAK
jgi:hypothetical protein